MNNIYEFIKSKEKPEPKKKVVYQLTVDSENEPFVSISYVELDGTQITMESEIKMLDRISKDASYIARRLDINVDKLIPIVYNPETKYFTKEYSGNSSKEKNCDDFLLGYVVDRELSEKMTFTQKVEKLVFAVSNGVNAKDKLSKYDFEFMIEDYTMQNTDTNSGEFFKEYNEAVVEFLGKHDHDSRNYSRKMEK